MNKETRYFRTGLVLVGLSRLDSNKYRRVIHSTNRHQAPLYLINNANNTNDDYFCSISHNDNGRNTHINKFGEQEVHSLKQQHKYLADVEIAEIVAAYRSGETTYELADKYNCHRKTIVEALKKQGVTVSKCKAQKKLNTEEVIKLYSEYHTTAEIGKRFGVNSGAIIKCLRDNGVTIRSRWDYPKP